MEGLINLNKITNWLLEPYKIGTNEIRDLRKLQRETTDKGKKNRLHGLISFNVIIFIIHTFLLAMIATYIVLTFVNVFSFLGIAFIIPIIMFLKWFYRNRYMKFRKVYINKDPNSIKYF